MTALPHERKPILGGTLEQQLCEAEAWSRCLEEWLRAIIEGGENEQARIDKAYETYCRERDECAGVNN